MTGVDVEKLEIFRIPEFFQNVTVLSTTVHRYGNDTRCDP